MDVQSFCGTLLCDLTQLSQSVPPIAALLRDRTPYDVHHNKNCISMHRQRFPAGGEPFTCSLHHILAKTNAQTLAGATCLQHVQLDKIWVSPAVRLHTGS